LATLATVAVNGARTRARDSKRISDLKQISTALEMYYADYTAYPSIITPGQPLVSADGSKTYMAKVPNNPTPRAEGACADLDYQYAAGNDNYSLIGCLSKAVGDVPAGARRIEKSGQTRDLGPTNGLVGWWMLDGINGTKDLAGGKTATIIGGISTSTGRFGEANGSYYSDGGGGSYLSVPNFNWAQTPANYTYSVFAWVKIGVQNEQYLISSWSQVLKLVHGTTNNMLLYAHNSLYQYGYVNLQDGTWHFVGFVFRGSDSYKQIYVDNNYVVSGNGLAVTSVAIASTINLFTQSLGYVSDVRIYDRVLSAAEVSALYNATR